MKQRWEHSMKFIDKEHTIRDMNVKYEFYKDNNRKTKTDAQKKFVYYDLKVTFDRSLMQMNHFEIKKCYEKSGLKLYVDDVSIETSAGDSRKICQFIIPNLIGRISFLSSMEICDLRVKTPLMTKTENHIKLILHPNTKHAYYKFHNISYPFHMTIYQAKKVTLGNVKSSIFTCNWVKELSIQSLDAHIVNISNSKVSIAKNLNILTKTFLHKCQLSSQDQSRRIYFGKELFFDYVEADLNGHVNLPDKGDIYDSKICFPQTTNFNRDRINVDKTSIIEVKNK